MIWIYAHPIISACACASLVAAYIGYQAPVPFHEDFPNEKAKWPQMILLAIFWPIVLLFFACHAVSFIYRRMDYQLRTRFSELGRNHPALATHGTHLSVPIAQRLDHPL